MGIKDGISGNDNPKKGVRVWGVLHFCSCKTVKSVHDPTG